MIRKKLIISLLALGGMVLGATPAASAQKVVGEWNIYPIYNSTIDNIVDGNKQVYFMSGGCLYSFDKETNEMMAYSLGTKLNDASIASIHYNADGGYLLVAYTSANIDLLFDDGRVMNISDIKSANLNIDKAINDVHFADGRIYVATTFGFVTIDDKTGNIVESAMLDKSVGAIGMMDDQLLIFIGAPLYSTYYAPVNVRHTSFDVFKKFTGGSVNYYVTVNRPNWYLTTTNGKLRFIQSSPTYSYAAKFVDHNVTPLFKPRRNSNGEIYAVTKSEIVYFNDDAEITRRVALPEPLAGQMIDACGDESSLWAADTEGIANYSVSADGTVTVLADKAKPQGTSSVREVAYMRVSKDGSRIYLSNIGMTQFKSVGGDRQDIPQATDYIENGKIYDASLPVASADMPDTKRYQQRDNSTKMYGGCQRFAIDPDNPRRYYMANWLEGVYVIEDNQEIAKFDRRNMPAWNAWNTGAGVGAIAEDVFFDPEGNLWVGCWQAGSDFASYCVLPKAKLKGDLSAVTVADWSQGALDDQGQKDMASVMTKGGIMFNWDYRYSSSSYLFITDTKKTYTNTADDVVTEQVSFTDQDGKVFNPDRWICGVEDARGRVWMGTDQGIVEFTNPANATKADFRVTRLKVPRNDGTIYADYLLESEMVNDIACDASNRKWVATEGSGVYLVSENGDRIIEHFTAENSDLPTNTVQSVVCDPNSNVVYFGTNNGLVSYNSSSSPAAPDYSDVYAYPNPVRPDYTGWITIKGLMKDSLVKIADTAGNVFYQTRSDGGMVVWDGCNASGERVRSGVYFVYASQNADGSNSGVVTKILVVN